MAFALKSARAGKVQKKPVPHPIKFDIAKEVFVCDQTFAPLAAADKAINLRSDRPITPDEAAELRVLFADGLYLIKAHATSVFSNHTELWAFPQSCRPVSELNCATQPTWRDRIKVHPAAEMFPMVGDAELAELAADIAKHGLHEGVTLWTDEFKVTAALEDKWWEAREAGKLPRGLFLLDGRNRLDAIERAFTDPEQRKAAITVALGDGMMIIGPRVATSRTLTADIDPYAYVVSANIHRRHLTAEQKREVIARVLKSQPERSDRAIGKLAQASHHTVAKVRAEQEATGQIAQLDQRVGVDGKARQQPASRPDIAIAPAPATSAGNTPEPSQRTLDRRLRDEHIANSQPAPLCPACAPELAKLRPLIDGLKAEGKKNMATMSPGTVAHLTALLQRLVDGWTDDPKLRDLRREIAKTDELQ